MNSLSASLNPFALARAVPTNVPDSARPPSSKTRELMAAFDELVCDFNSKGRLPDPSRLVCECMKHDEVGVLREVLAFFKEMRTLRIQGPLDGGGWGTLANAIPHGFTLAVLTLSDLVFDRFAAELLFQALGKMPALVDLSLHRVGAEAGVMDASECPALKQLNTLSVVEAGFGEPGYASESKDSVCDLLIKLLGVCQVQNLSINGLRFKVSGSGSGKLEGPVVTVDQNTRLGQALCRQSELQVLRIKRCRALVHVQDAMNPVQGSGHHLVQKTPVYEIPSLRLLDLSGNLLPGRTTAAILVALGQGGTCLRHLNLSGNFIGDSTVAAMAFLLMKNRTLLSLSFEDAKGRDIHGAKVEHLVTQGELKQLTEALEHNTSLRRLSFEATAGVDRRALLACLKRNRAAFRFSALRAMLNSSGYRLSNDLVDHFAEEGARYLDGRDALNLSSVNKKALDARHRLLE
ncbi:Ran GTPase-activating protein (RanGAP) involved in mRNA processing and transport [Variovorax sp. PBL-H6]|uniref:hypothetical protein n=1 Tax=Variovorax sp. PBL-H6 TaxID=434009 RepID=UPI001315E5E3|nr:hypothetical protein [Variovorax sp. PBL-H6]VTU17072.1 Ran GTPase-activating protein (RanGAP) involved in mRNA processing and transport [Variovorax sp. PBL-H6]